MKIFEKPDGNIIIADKVVEYADSIQRDYEYALQMEDSVRETFMSSAFGHFTMAQTELTSEESDLLCGVLKSRIKIE